MAKVIRRRWESDQQSGLARRDRQSCDYDAYILTDSWVGQLRSMDRSPPMWQRPRGQLPSSHGGTGSLG